MNSLRLAAAGCAIALFAAACEHEDRSSAERAGEDLDAALEETFQGEEQGGEGFFERAGEVLAGDDDVEDLEDLGEEIGDDD